jgi:hypothetical protein
LNRIALESAMEAARRLGVELDEDRLSVIVEAYLDDLERQRNAETPEEAALRQLDEVADQVNSAVEVAGETEDWQPVYDLIFDGDGCLAERAREIADDLGMSFPAYVDPDTTYREDSEAWIWALGKFRSRLVDDIGMTAAGYG